MIYLILFLFQATTASAALNGPFAYSGYRADEPVAQQKARWRSQNNTKKATYSGCKYFSDFARAPVVIETYYQKGCAPQQICVADLDCRSQKMLDLLGNPLVMHVRCLAKDGKCPKDPGDCGMAGNIDVKASGAVAISKDENYFDLPWKKAIDESVDSKKTKKVMEAN